MLMDCCRVSCKELPTAAQLKCKEPQSKTFMDCMILSSSAYSVSTRVPEIWIILWRAYYTGMYFSDPLGPPSRKYSFQGLTQRLEYTED